MWSRIRNVCRDGFKTGEVEASLLLPRKKGENLSFPPCHLNRKKKKISGLLSLSISPRLAWSRNSSSKCSYWLSDAGCGYLVNPCFGEHPWRCLEVPRLMGLVRLPSPWSVCYAQGSTSILCAGSPLSVRKCFSYFGLIITIYCPEK